MRDHEFREHGRPEDLLQELGYETQDIQYKKFARYGFFFLLFFVVMIISGFGVMLLMVPTHLRGGRTVDYIPKTQAPAGTPLLQTNITTRTDIESLRKGETAEMTTPAVIDQQHQVYRIPVNDAIDILASQGLPKTPPMPRGGGAAAPTNPANAVNGPATAGSNGTMSTTGGTAGA